MSQIFGFFRYHLRADALVHVIDLALLRFKLFQICAILFEVNSGCPGTGCRILSLNFDLVFLIDDLFSKMKPSVFISFLAFHIKVAMVTETASVRLFNPAQSKVTSDLTLSVSFV